MPHNPTGSGILDSALAGGIPSGSAFLAQGEEGAGATEFALTLLRSTTTLGQGHRARIASALRSSVRIQRELGDLFEDEKMSIEIVSFAGGDVHDGCTDALRGLSEGDVLVLESADSLVNGGGETGLIKLWNKVANAAADQGVSVIMLHAPGTLAHATEAALAEGSDGVLSFRWLDSGSARRRVLEVSKIRGLAPILDGDQVPLFEVSLHRGIGFAISPVTSVL